MHATEAPARFWRSVGIVLSGAAAAQAIPLLGSLVVARLYAPAEFGVFAAWLGMAALAAVGLTGRYEVSLAIEPDGEPRRIGFVSTLAAIALATGLLASGLLAVLALGLLPDVPAALLLAFVPAAAAIAAAQAWQSWAAAEGRFAQLSSMRMAQAIAVTGLQILVGWLAPSAVTLGLAHGAGVLLGIAVAARALPVGRWPGGTVVRAYWRRHARFPMLSLPADTVNTAAGQLPLLIVAGRFGADIAGLLALTLRTLGAPIGLLGAAVLDVFKRRAASSYRERGECRADYLQTLRVLALGSLAVSVVFVLFSETIFAVAFGETWRHAGTIAVWLMPMFALRFVASPLSYMFYIAGKQHIDLVWQLALLGMTLATMLVPVTHAGALQWYSAGYSAMYLVYLVLSYRFSLGKKP
jgi:O-antigen/teichoic acid export membrane protein